MNEQDKKEFKEAHEKAFKIEQKQCENCEHREITFWKGFFLGSIVPLGVILGVLIGGMF